MFRFRVLHALCLSAALLLAPPIHAQLGSESSSFVAAAPDSGQPFLFELPLNNAQPHPAAAKPKESLGSLTTGWTYLWADQGGYRSNLNGWFLRPSFNVGRGFSVFFDSTNYYGANKKGSVNSHGFTFGVGRQFFAHAKLKPSLFAEAGDVRSSGAGTITNQFAFAAGFSFNVPLNKHVELAVTPAEYIFLCPNSTVRNDYNAKVGLSFPFGHR